MLPYTGPMTKRIKLVYRKQENETFEQICLECHVMQLSNMITTSLPKSISEIK